jgi:acyl-CoA thioester hydrolase
MQEKQSEMSRTPVVYESLHQMRFSDLDPYHHVRAEVYSACYINHRMDGLRQYTGWDTKTLAKLPFMLWVRRMEVDFIRSVVGDQVITITSFVREFRDSDAYIECSMADESGRPVSRCLMVVACIDRDTKRAMDWPADAMALFFEPEMG